MHNQKGFAPIVIALIMLVLAGAGGTSYYLMNKNIKNNINNDKKENKQNIDKDSSNSAEERLIYQEHPDPDNSRTIFYLFNPLSKEKEELPIDEYTNSVCLEGEKLYYTSGDSLNFYDFKSRHSEFVANISDDNFMYFYSFSPDCHYAILDSGTSTGNRGRGLYDIKNGKFIAIPKESGTNVEWSPNSDKFVLLSGTIDFFTGADLTLDSIYLEEINGNKVTETPILLATKKESYSLVKWISNDVLMYAKDTFSDSIKLPISGVDSKEIMDFNNDLYNNRKINYFTLNVNTMAISPASEALKDSLNDPIVMISPLSDYKIMIKKNGNKHYNNSYYDVNLSKINDTDNFLVTSKHFSYESVIWLSVSADNTSGWKTYINKELGIEFKYPENWKKQETTSGFLLLSPADITSNENLDPHFHTYSALISIISADTKDNLMGAVTDRYGVDKLYMSNDWLSEIENRRYKENEFLFIHEKVQAFGECHYFIKKDSILIDIERDDRLGCEDEQFIQMLSNFKFVY